MAEQTFTLTTDRRLVPCRFADLIRPADAPTAAWIDANGVDAERLDEILKGLDLHHLAIDACHAPIPIAGLIAYGASLFIGLPVQNRWDDAERTYLRIICSPNVIVTIHQQPIAALEQIIARFSDGLRFHGSNTSAILYQILDHLIDEDMAFTLQTRDAVDRLENLLDGDQDDQLTAQTTPLKRQLARLSATFEDQLYCLGMLQKIESESFHIEGLHEYFRDAFSHLDHASRSISRQTAHLATIQQEHQLRMQDQTNGRLRLLTIVSTIFMPLTLIAGIYGMNFTNMPELTWSHGYAAVLILMVVTAVGMLWGFLQAGWFR